MEHIEIKYDTHVNCWVNIIRDKLNTNDIIYKTDLPYIICNSLKYSITEYLYKNGFEKPTTREERINLLKRLKHNGLDIIIRSNDTLWKYLEYFNDITDYSKCFDIKIIIVDEQKVLKSTEFTLVNNNIMATPSIQKINTNYKLLEDTIKDIVESLGKLLSIIQEEYGKIDTK